MSGEHWFWRLLLLAVLVWYSTMTIYVAVRGLVDIRQMFRRLGGREAGDETNPSV